MKKIIAIVLFLFLLFVGIILILGEPNFDNMDITTFVLLKVCGVSIFIIAMIIYDKYIKRI